MRLYETAVVIDTQLKSDEIDELMKKFVNFITNHGGEIVNVTEWGKRRLAYEINKRQYGYYAIIRFSGPAQIITLLEREYRLNENVLRYRTTKVATKLSQSEAMRRRQEVEKAEEVKKRAAAAAKAAEAAEAAEQEQAAEADSEEAPAETAEAPAEEASPEAEETVEATTEPPAEPETGSPAEGEKKDAD